MNAYSDEEDAREAVIRAAFDLVDTWDMWVGEDYVAVRDLEQAVNALRSLDADRGLRGARTPGEQEPD